jgi:DNA replication and repair protein RecF
MTLRRLWLRDFRSYAEAEVSFGPGLTVVVGPNGTGKTNLLEAAGYLSILASFRKVPTDGLVRLGAERCVIRGEVDASGREVLIESEVVLGGRSRVLLNKQPLKRNRELRDVLRITVFSPEDLLLVKGGPGERRDFLDDVLVMLHPRNDAMLSELERVLRQRNALLKQAGGRLSPEVGFTLDVWDDKLGKIGTDVAECRRDLLDELRPYVVKAYEDVADRAAPVQLAYGSAWLESPDGLAGALARGRSDDVRRGLSLVGPHRDEVEMLIEGRPSRTHASQGEQRTLALALRLAAHRLVTERLGSSPLLLLDDVFSELDPARSDALVRHLPPGQALLATAGFVPPAAEVESVLCVSRGDGPTELRSGDKPVESVDETAWDRVR